MNSSGQESPASLVVFAAALLAGAGDMRRHILHARTRYQRALKIPI